MWFEYRSGYCVILMIWFRVNPKIRLYLKAPLYDNSLRIILRSELKLKVGDFPFKKLSTFALSCRNCSFIAPLLFIFSSMFDHHLPSENIIWVFVQEQWERRHWYWVQVFAPTVLFVAEQGTNIIIHTQTLCHHASYFFFREENHIVHSHQTYIYTL